MSMTSPPPEAQRFGRSQTPESPRPVHLPEPSNIPVLRNQMDPVFNDTATYNIPNDHSFSSFSEPTQHAANAQPEEHDAVQDFFRAADEESSKQIPVTNPIQATPASAVANPPTLQETQTSNGSSDTIPSKVLESGTEGQSQPNEVAHASNETTQKEVEGPTQQENQNNEAGVDYQSLLDTISQSTSTAPAADALTAPTPAAATVQQGPPASSLPAVPGLPPKPPALDHPAEFASFHLPESNAAAKSNAESISAQQETLAAPQSFVYQANPNAEAMYPARGYEPATGDRPWSPNTQSIYDQFLEDERGYVTEGIWDRFPNGSRLFVGNLPSEKVTKRDLFHIFHRHGKLAQISIKQAYGFVQFLQASDCHKALEADQGVEIRGRKIHLEISKPQKNSRNASGTHKNERASNNRRRSRSPDRRSSNDRQNGRGHPSEFRDRRDSYRRTRSPSPRGYRTRDDGRQNGRSPPRTHVSPHATTFPPPYPPPFAQPYDEDAALPLPRRNPQDVPDVQLLILDQSVPQAFINWVENGFRSKGLRASTIWLSPRLPLQAVIKRQILEGVHAIVKLLQVNSMNYKIPLQVFDRSSGASNVKFNEYVDLDLNVAGDIVVHAKRSQPSPTVAYPPANTFSNPPQYGHPQAQSPQQYSPHGQPPYQQRPPPPAPYPYPQQHPLPPPQYAQGQPPTPSSANPNAPNLQQLLANLRQPSQTPPVGPSPAPAQGRPDLSGLLSNIAARQQNQNQVPPYAAQASPQGYGTTPNSAHSYGPGPPQNNVQNIMDQLARYQR